jgi:hypothetical protein
MTSDTSSPTDASAEQQRWQSELGLRERETILKEKAAAHEMALKDRELESKLRDQRWARWLNPLVIAIFAAALAAAGNALLAFINGSAQVTLEREKAATQKTLEETKAETSRILEVIKTADPAKALVNLKFLLEAGLITDPERKKSLEAYLAKPGEGPSLPAVAGARLSSDPPNYNLPPPANNPQQTRAANRLLRVAIAEINRNVDENTATDRIQQYWQATNTQVTDVSTMPWSAAFLSWLIREAGNKDGLPMSTANLTIWNDAVHKKLTFAPNEKSVLPGDIVIQTRTSGGPSLEDIRAGKVDFAPTSSGIVHTVTPEKFSIIVGNTGNAIRLRDLTLKTPGLVGFIRLSDVQ